MVGTNYFFCLTLIIIKFKHNSIIKPPYHTEANSVVANERLPGPEHREERRSSRAGITGTRSDGSKVLGKGSWLGVPGVLNVVGAIPTP
jgi:hypothetical protein